GSFRGVPFEVEGDELGGAGRRKAVLEAPGRDRPFVQDLGRSKEEVRIRALVVGADYDRQRDALLDAIRRPGVGELVHPQYGSRQATALPAKTIWSNREQGMVRFELTFILDPIEVALASAQDPVALASSARSSVASTAALSVERAIGTSPSNIDLDAARGASDSVEGALREAVESSSRFAGLQDRAARAVELVREVDRLSRLSLQRGSDWALWLNGYSSAATSFGGSFGSRLAAFRGLLDLARQIAGLGGVGTARRVQGAAASSTLGAAVEAGAEVGTGWDSRQEAISAQEEVLQAVDEQLESAPDELIAPLEEIRVAAVASIPAPGVELPELTTFTPSAPIPAILASHQLYGTPDRGDEIAVRNRIANPGKLPPEPLEVLVDA
ncbi:MAG: DNA circularization N-terminal domain-containing protein, partial [Planctomycetota bacterium]